MPTDPNLQDRLGEVIGLAQAVRRMVRQITDRIEPKDQLELARLLERFTVEVGEMQRRCDSLVASQPGFTQSRVTARAREIKVRVTRSVPERAATVELLTALALAARAALARWRALAAMVSFDHDTRTADLVKGAILLHEGHVQELSRHLP